MWFGRWWWWWRTTLWRAPWSFDNSARYYWLRWVNYQIYREIWTFCQRIYITFTDKEQAIVSPVDILPLNDTVHTTPEVPVRSNDDLEIPPPAPVRSNNDLEIPLPDLSDPMMIWRVPHLHPYEPIMIRIYCHLYPTDPMRNWSFHHLHLSNPMKGCHSVQDHSMKCRDHGWPCLAMQPLWIFSVWSSARRHSNSLHMKRIGMHSRTHLETATIGLILAKKNYSSSLAWSLRWGYIIFRD